ncbi:alpha/beta-hydrolase, partial [Multifurca ochricompacta]
INDLNLHILEAGNSTKPLIILLHGFPELSYSWRKLIPPLADAGYHVVAPDQRGYGRTTPVSPSGPGLDTGRIRYEDDPFPYRMFNVVRDIIALVHALGYSSVHAVVGHDFGSPVAGLCALVRPDLFERVVLMSAPFTGAPSYTMPGQPKGLSPAEVIPILSKGLADLRPPRKHYTFYFSSPEANADMHGAMKSREDLHAFLRAYFHVKSADWEFNEPHELLPAEADVGSGPGGSASPASALAELPEYYVMKLEKTMPESVLPFGPSVTEVAENGWLPDDELRVYVDEIWRTGFQGGLNWYRNMTGSVEGAREHLMMFSGMHVQVPAMYIAGAKDWGTLQLPGSAEKMREVCTRMGPEGEGFVLVEGAGHWVQQEEPRAVLHHLLRFFSNK